MQPSRAAGRDERPPGGGGGGAAVGPAARAPWAGVGVAAALALALLGTGCGTDGRGGGGDAGFGAERLGVMASVPPVGWFVEAVGGDLVDVAVLVPPGASPATYEPTHRQLRRLDGASIWVTVGHPRFPFEAAWRGRLTEGRPDLRVVPSGEGCRRGAGDPHLWMSPACARSMVERVAEALVEARPAHADSFRAGRRRALEAVDAVDRELGDLLAPHRGRAFLVFHPALGYLARDYGLEQMSIQRGATEPNPAELDRLVRRARERGIRDVLVQPQFSREAAALVADELPGGRVVTVDPLAPSWPRGMRSIGRTLAEAFADRPAGRSP